MDDECVEKVAGTSTGNEERVLTLATGVWSLVITRSNVAVVWYLSASFSRMEGKKTYVVGLDHTQGRVSRSKADDVEVGLHVGECEKGLNF